MSPVEELLSKLIRPLRLLCVEDDKEVATVLSAQLNRRYECEVDWVKTGEEAIEKLGKCQYDLVLLDLVLPGIDGVEVLRYAKKLSPYVPVVVLTGFPNSTLAQQALQHGVLCLLSKPHNIDDFEEVFRLFRIRVRSKEDETYFQSRGCATAGSV